LDFAYILAGIDVKSQKINMKYQKHLVAVLAASVFRPYIRPTISRRGLGSRSVYLQHQHLGFLLAPLIWAAGVAVK
jgi:hypothetical protein